MPYVIAAISSESVVAACTVVGTAGVLGALVFSGLQTRWLRKQLMLANEQNQRTTSLEQASLDLQLMECIMEVDRVFIEWPEMHEFFFEDSPTPLENPDRARVLAIADLLLDVTDSVASARRHGHMLDEDYEAWRGALRNYFANSPAMRDLWPEFGYCYGPGTAELLGVPVPKAPHEDEAIRTS